MRFSCRAALFAPASTATLRTVPARVQKQHDRGASDTGIRIGNTVPYSGPASAFDVFAPCAGHAAAHPRAGGAGRRLRGAGAGAA